MTTNSQNINIAEIAGYAGDINEKDTPCIPQKVYENLPEFLRNITSKFSKDRERDIFFTGFLGVSSACLNKIYTVYDSRTAFANMFMFVSAPAGSGKGNLAFVRDIFKPYETYINSLGEDNRQSLFVPGNSTASALISQLKDCDKGGRILFETEADTLTNALSQEHGNFSDILRKVFHHEEISLSRVTDRQFEKIDKPQLSLVLSGTPAQVRNLIPSVENGLFSRFSIYNFTTSSGWKGLSYNFADNSTQSLEEYFKGKGEELLGLISVLNSRDSQLQFRLTEKQVDSFNRHNEKIFDYLENNNYGATDILFRNALNIVRTALILSFFRQHEHLSNKSLMYCEDVDFEIALDLCRTYFLHNLYIYKESPSSNGKKTSPDQMFFANLPKEFTKFQALEIGAQLNLKDRTVGYRLDDLCKTGQLIKPKNGFYQKVS